MAAVLNHRRPLTTNGPVELYLVRNFIEKCDKMPKNSKCKTSRIDCVQNYNNCFLKELNSYKLLDRFWLCKKINLFKNMLILFYASCPAKLQ